MRIAMAVMVLTLSFSMASSAFAQEPTEAERIVEAYFQNQNYAASQAAFTCPGDDPVSDSVMELLSRPRSEVETMRLLPSWGGAAPCRVEQILGWYVHAARVIRTRIDARVLARGVLAVDAGGGTEVLRSAATDGSVRAPARGAYQEAVFGRLNVEEQVDLYVETLIADLQAGDYPNVGLEHAFDGPDPARTTLDLVAKLAAVPNEARAAAVIGRVLSVVVYDSRKFGPTVRRDIWTELEASLPSLPTGIREVVESYGSRLTSG